MLRTDVLKSLYRNPGKQRSGYYLRNRWGNRLFTESDLQRIEDELPLDVVLLEEHHPELLEALKEVIFENIESAENGT